MGRLLICWRGELVGSGAFLVAGERWPLDSISDAVSRLVKSRELRILRTKQLEA